MTWIINKLCDINSSTNITDTKIVNECYKIVNLKNFMFNLSDINYAENKVLIFELLNQLTYAPVLNDDIFYNILNMKDDYNLIFACVNNDKIVGLLTILIEYKFIHGGKCVAHIEDLVVDKVKRHQKIGGRLIKFAVEYARILNCYKIILNCNEDLSDFYRKNDFYPNGICMRYNLPSENVGI